MLDILVGIAVALFVWFWIAVIILKIGGTIVDRIFKEVDRPWFFNRPSRPAGLQKLPQKAEEKAAFMVCPSCSYPNRLPLHEYQRCFKCQAQIWRGGDDIQVLSKAPDATYIQAVPPEPTNGGLT